MDRRAMSILKPSRDFALTALAALALASPVNAQVQEAEPDAEDIARTPLADLNIDAKDIPAALVEAAQDPYATNELTDCNAIVSEVAKLDQVLGNDYDLAGEQEGGLSEGRVAQNVVGGLIPFRGLVREVSGAAGDQRKAQAAVTAGMVRRGFLKGLGLQRGCNYPARPRPEQAGD